MQSIDTGHGVKGVMLRGDKFLVLLKPDGQYDLPGGRLEQGERSKEALAREIFEETGLTGVAITDVGVPWTLVSKSGSLIKGKTWLCRTGDCQIRLSSEHSGYIWEPVDQLRDIDAYGRYGLDKLGPSLQRTIP